MDEKTVAAFVVITILAIAFTVAAPFAYCAAIRNKLSGDLLALALFLHALSVILIVIATKMWDSCF